jgi:hypothetical protein
MRQVQQDLKGLVLQAWPGLIFLACSAGCGSAYNSSLCSIRASSDTLGFRGRRLHHVKRNLKRHRSCIWAEYGWEPYPTGKLCDEGLGPGHGLAWRTRDPWRSVRIVDIFW